MISQTTGYPSVDKPWLRYYSSEAINTVLPQLRIKMDNLKEYKKQIENLSEEEKRKRDKAYIMPLAKGELYGPQTGYSSIDKPWLKNYNSEDLDYEIPDCSIYEYMYQNCQKFSDKKCMEFGTGKSSLKITYKRMFEMIDTVAKSLKQMNVKKGDVVSVCMPNTPEVAYIFYAINKVGAVANMLDPRTNPANLKSSIKDSNSKLLISLDKFIPLFEKIINETNLENAFELE